MNKKMFSIFLVIMLLLTVIFDVTKPLQAFADTNDNLALNKPTFSSGAEADSVSNDKAVDGAKDTKWSSIYEVQDPSPDVAWWSVDLGSEKSIQSVVIQWGDAYAKTYQLLVSSDNTTWTNVKGSGVNLTGHDGKETINFDAVTARYVKFQGVERSLVHGGLFGYAISEFEVYREQISPDPNVNLALNKLAFSSGAEADSVSNDKAVDGAKDTKWSSIYEIQDPSPDVAWWSVDLGSEKSIQSVIIQWGDAYAKTYQLLVSSDNTTWTNVKGSGVNLTGHDGKETINFDAVTARYVKFQGVERSVLNGSRYGYAISEFEVYRDQISPDPNVNLALNKLAFSSGAEADSVSNDKAVDGSTSTKWSSIYEVQDPSPDVAWWSVDLGSEKSIQSVIIQWGDAYAKTYQLLVSSDNTTWTNVKGSGVNLTGHGGKETINFDAVTVRYVKFQGVERSVLNGSRYGYAISEFEVYRDQISPGTNVNLALNKLAFSSGAEADSVSNDKAVDGSISTRWSSIYEIQDPSPDVAWWSVDLGSEKSIQSVVIQWGDAYAKTYQLLVSSDNTTWTNVKGSGVNLTGHDGKETINFDAVTARYVKFQGVERSLVRGGLYGYAISEFEVYIEPLKDNLAQVIANQIKEIAAISAGQARIVLPQMPDGYQVTLYGSDRLQVIDKEGNIHPPLVDAKVNLLFKVEDKSNPKFTGISGNVLVTVPGQFIQTDDLNKEPKVIPSLREWLGRTGELALTNSSRIVVNPADAKALEESAELTRADLKDISSYNLDIVYEAPKPGDIFLSMDSSLSYLGDEGYVLDVQDYVSIRSANVIGVFYGTRSVLQILKQDEEHRHIVKGISRDYPKYAVRGLMLDVARKFYTIDFLRDYVKLMSWYKMNQFQIHLNDNIGKEMAFEDGTYSAFRLESTTYPGLTSKSGSYTKKEFRELQQLGMEYGVDIIPEIDTPGHSSAFVDYKPALGNGNHLDISKPETVNFVKGLYDEYLDGVNPTFIGPNVHIGTDEYDVHSQAGKEVFRGYMNTLIDHINTKGKHPYFWGGLEEYNGTTPVRTDVTMDVWKESAQSPQNAIEKGFNIVNVQDAYLYIVPVNRDYLDTAFLYNEWEPVKWLNYTLPYGHPNLMGGKFALWNDVSEEHWLTMDDSHDRILPAMQVLSEKLWTGTREDRNYAEYLKTAKAVGEAPQTNISHKIKVKNSEGRVMEFLFDEGLKDSSGQSFDGAGTNITMTKGKFDQGVRFNGGASYIKTPLQALGFGWTVSMWINPDVNNPDDAIIMESPQGQLKLKQGTTGKLGLSKGRYNSVFNYAVPAGKWTHLMLTGDNSTTTLYVNSNEYVESLPLLPIQSFILPTQIIGSKTHSFIGVLDNLMVYNKPFSMEDKNNLALHKPAFSSGAEVSYVGPEKLVDGNKSSKWSSDYTITNPDAAWWSVDLGAPTEFNEVVINWADAYASKYQILVSNDNANWTNVKGNGITLSGKAGEESIQFDNLTARYVKFQGVKRIPVDGHFYGYAINEISVYKKDISRVNRMAEYKTLTGQATDLLDSGKGNKDLRKQLILLLKNYPYDFGGSFDVLKLTIASLQSSISNPGSTDGSKGNPGSTDGSYGKPPIVLPQDGTLTLPAGQSGSAGLGEDIKVTIPVGATDKQLLLIIKKISNLGSIVGEQDVLISSVYEVLKNFTDNFLKPVTISLAFDPTKLGANQKASIFYYDETAKKWVKIGGMVVGNRISVETDHFTKFAVFAVSNEATDVPTKLPVFADITKHWAEASIVKAVAAGFVNGYEDGTFKPNAEVTRAEFAVMLSKAFGLQGSGAESAFTDGAQIGSWAKKGIAQAVEAGIIKGYADGSFRPKAQISRSEMVAMVVRAKKLETSNTAATAFTDDKRIPSWAQGAVNAAVQLNLISGRGNNKFVPDGTASRVEAVTLLLRALESGK